MKINSIHKDTEEFIENLDKQSQSEVLRATDLLGGGCEIGVPYSKKITKTIYELRIKSVQNIRIFYTFHNNEVFLLHVVNKQKQKLPRKDLTTAINGEKWLH